MQLGGGEEGNSEARFGCKLAMQQCFQMSRVFQVLIRVIAGEVGPSQPQPSRGSLSRRKASPDSRHPFFQMRRLIRGRGGEPHSAAYSTAQQSTAEHDFSLLQQLVLEGGRRSSCKHPWIAEGLALDTLSRP
jgi:hypothetical protein